MLAGRCAVITGASRGIGLAVARRFREAGAEVAMLARGAATLGDAAERVGGVALVADVGDVAAMERLPDRLESLLGVRAPDILVNAAGAFDLAPLAATTPACFDAHVDTNLRGPFLVIRAFLTPMLERGSGHIATIGSIAGRRAFPMNGAYAASKFGVRGLHAVLDLELKGTGVRCTLIEPAATDTPIWDAIDRAAHPGLPERAAMLDADAVADAVLFAVTRPAATAIPTISLERA